MNKNASKNSKSLYGKSMKMVANFVRLSSFSTAKASFRAPSLSPPDAGKLHKPVNLLDIPPPQHGNLRSHELQRSSNPTKYMIEMVDNINTSSNFIMGEEDNVDGMASDYIRKVHEKNKTSSDDA